MQYQFEQTDQQKVFTPSFDSFWLFYDFRVSASTKIITINDAMFAVYLSQKSGGKSINKPEFREQNEAGTFEITEVAGKQKIKLSQATLLASRLVEFSNEIGRLHLFKFWETSTDDPKMWIEPKWTSKAKNPDKNDDNSLFLNHELDFGDINKRYIYWLSTQEDNNGTSSVALAMPFLNNSPFSLLLSKHRDELPIIKISSSKHGTWQYPEAGAEDLPGELQGFAMVCAGAFKSIALSSEIDEYYQFAESQPEQQGGKKAIIAKLSKAVHEYKPFRTLSTVTMTDQDSVVSVPSDKPIEVLYLEKLNSEGYVKPIIT